MKPATDKIVVPSQLLSDVAVIPQKVAFRETVTTVHIRFFAGLNGAGYILTEDDKLIDLNIYRDGTNT